MNTNAPTSELKATQVFPRRAFVAAILSAATAGGAVALGILGGMDRPASDSFAFSRGIAFAAGEDARLRGFLTQALADDRIQVIITGHTGDAGDAAANQNLSDERAMTAANMASSLGIAAGRVSALGVGGDAPLARLDGESDRGFQSRLARVDVVLQMRR